jgi:hypothetical protein
MSWEPCGYRPGPFTPARCPVGECSECDGEHHFYAEPDEDGEDYSFVCKHCELRVEMVDDDAEEWEERRP